MGCFLKLRKLKGYTKKVSRFYERCSEGLVKPNPNPIIDINPVHEEINDNGYCEEDECNFQIPFASFVFFSAGFMSMSTGIRHVQEGYELK